MPIAFNRPISGWSVIITPHGRWNEKPLPRRTRVMAGWIAPIATIVAAMMIAANLGARLTGWGFVICTLGSVCWASVGFSTHQASLLAANGFLTLVNLAGVWRWLGAYEDGGQSAKAASRKSPSPTLSTATGIAGMPVLGADDEALGKAVDALIECHSGKVSYVVVTTADAGGLGEQLRAVPRDAITFHGEQLLLDMQRAGFDALVPLTPGDWPARAEGRTDELAPAWLRTSQRIRAGNAEFG